MNLNLFFPEEFIINDVEIEDNSITINLASVNVLSECPICKRNSERIHSSYGRMLYDLKMLGKTVVIKLLSRKFFCDETSCSRKIFTERFENFIKPYSRRTERLNEVLVKLAFSLSSEAASRISKYVFSELSADTFIRIIRNQQISIKSNYRCIGIDDWAFRKGSTYGTLICDLETHQPIEVLKDRTTKTLANWLKDHKSIEIVTRDRANAYTKAVDDTLPEAVQMADKWHLLKNMSETLNSILQSHYTKGITVENTPETKKEITGKVKATKQEIQHQTRLEKSMELIEETKRLYASGVTQKEISKLLGISKKTIYRYLRRTEPTYSSSRGRGSILDEFSKDIKDQFFKGIKSKNILSYIREKGYNGSDSLFRMYLSELKKLKAVSASESETNSSKKLIKREKLFKLFWKKYEDLTDSDQELLNKIIQISLELSRVYQAVQSYREIIRESNLYSFQLWIENNIKSEISHIKKFTQSLKKDKTAISNTLKYGYTNAVLEGHVNRLKNIKRMMYGRANFDLLRQRVLFTN